MGITLIGDAGAHAQRLGAVPTGLVERDERVLAGCQVVTERRENRFIASVETSGMTKVEPRRVAGWTVAERCTQV
jgi:hypothetical protein